MKSAELRQKFLKFFEDKGHKIIPSASLVPDESVELAGTQRVLFTTAGMHPLVPYLLGALHPEGKRLANVQRCLRTDDVDEVGDSVHNTFFEMLGNWSIGDSKSKDGIGKNGYWKEETIFWSYEFLINGLKLDAKRIYVSVFAGDNDAPFDEESFDIWVKLGMPKDHIFKYNKKDNWWGPVGESGPCGPDTEMFYDLDPKASGQVDPSQNSQRFVEIWNDVFMQYDKQKDGSYIPLKQKNVDTGMGLERILAVLQNVPSVYETDVFLPLMSAIENMATSYNTKSARIIADHIRASVFLISDGITPSNVERGYILRRLIRRAIRHASLITINKDFLKDLALTVIKTYANFYPKLDEFRQTIFNELAEEEQKFKTALARGIREFEKIGGEISAQSAFNLYQNFGFPIELTIELAAEKDKKVDLKGYKKLFEKHQQTSRAGSQKAKGGLVTQTEKAAKLHTATHLLHQTLRDVLGHHVHQTGSHITEERLRFDFSHNQKMTDEQIKEVENIINQKIKENLKVLNKSMPKEAAEGIGAIGLFDQKYGDLVSVYYISPDDDINSAFSKEFCGGPHCTSTGQLKSFKIIKEESAGSNVRRIYATIDA